MSTELKITFAEPTVADSGTLVMFIAEGVVFGRELSSLIGKKAENHLKRAAEAEQFTGKEKQLLVVPAPEGISASRAVLVGIGGLKQRGETNYVNFGGLIAGQLGKASQAMLLLYGPEDWRVDAYAAADLALGMHLRAYDFDQYKTKKKDDAAKPASVKVVIGLRDPAGAKKAYKYAEAVAGGVTIARNLVNEPPNVLTPTAFAKQAAELSKLGVDVDILDEKQLGKIGMRALLAVGQGSRQDSRVVIMRWHGDKSSNVKNTNPKALIG